MPATLYDGSTNAFAERFVRSIKSECLDRLIVFGEKPLRRAVSDYIAHYHDERTHQNIGNVLINGEPATRHGNVVVRERLGGLLKHYHRHAA